MPILLPINQFSLGVCLRYPEYGAGVHGMFESGGTVWAFGGKKATAKASIFAFFLRMITYALQAVLVVAYVVV